MSVDVVPVVAVEDAALARSVAHLSSLQGPAGCWEGEMVWNAMILSQVVIVRHVTGRPFPPDERARVARHFEVTRTADGAWGLHRESGSYVYFTTLAYVALRLLGRAPDDPLLAQARRWLHAQDGGVLAIPSWGKLWLAMLGLYGWEGVNPTPPEAFLLPRALPLHPDNYYCHTRVIYAALSYLYGARFEADLGPLRDELRRELYDRSWTSLDFAGARHRVAATDLYVAPSAALRATQDALFVHEKVRARFLRRRALDLCFERIVLELRSTRHEGLSPVNGLLGCLALHSRRHPDLPLALDGLEAWRFEDEAGGIRYAGARSQTWDTAFAVEALVAGAAGGARTPELARAVAGAYRFLDRAQLQDEVPDVARQARDPARGGFCFSDGSHRWPVSDCTAEALSALLSIEADPALAPPPAERVARGRLLDAARFILLRQNPDGGFGTYERRRAGRFVEELNPSEMFGRCMTESSYVECTGSSIAALARVRPIATGALAREVQDAVRRGAAFLRAAARPDGSFPGFWGINFTYAASFAVRGLRAAGATKDDPLLARTAGWLVSKQRPDGGWGEHFSGCLTDRYVEAESGVVQTSWALLALLEVLGPRASAVERGAAFLRARQLPAGEWREERVNGVFFGSAMLVYRLYPAYFPAWALARRAALARDPSA